MSNLNLNPDTPSPATDLPPEGGGNGGEGTFRLDALSPLGGETSGHDAHGGGGGRSRKARLSQQTIFFSILFVAAGGVLFGMRRAGVGPIAAIANTKIPDYDVTKGPVVKLGDHQRVIEDLSATNTGAQVPADQVQKNPFMLAEALTGTPDIVTDPGANPEDPDVIRRRELEGRNKAVFGALAALEVQTIMGGSNPIARISGETYRPGDKLGDHFTVKAINGRAVELQTADGRVHTLSIDDKDEPKPAKRKK